MNWLHLRYPSQLLNSKTLRASAFAGIILTSGLTSGLLPSIANTPEVGLEIEGSRTLNQATIVDTNYVGECPGEGAGTVRGRFFSGAIGPAPGQRVVVRNTTRGTAGDPAPYTDRDYSKGRNSESTTIAFGTRHGLKTLNVLEGLNDFEYESDRAIALWTKANSAPSLAAPNAPENAKPPVVKNPTVPDTRKTLKKSAAATPPKPPAPAPTVMWYESTIPTIGGKLSDIQIA